MMYRTSILIVLLGQLAFATLSSGNMTGNGGDVIVCEKNKKRPIEFLDHFEARIKKFPIVYPKGSTEEEIAIKYIKSNMSVRFPLIAKRWTDAIQNIRSKISFVEEFELNDISDSDHVILPRGCEVKQIAIRKNPSASQKEYTIDKTLWDILPIEQRAQLLVHEVVYRDTTVEGGATHSIGLRDFIGLIISNQFSKKFTKDQEYVEYFQRKLNLPFFEKSGALYKTYDFRQDCSKGPCQSKIEKLMSPLKAQPGFDQNSGFALSYLQLDNGLKVTSRPALYEKIRVPVLGGREVYMPGAAEVWNMFWNKKDQRWGIQFIPHWRSSLLKAAEAQKNDPEYFAAMQSRDLVVEKFDGEKHLSIRPGNSHGVFGNHFAYSLEKSKKNDWSIVGGAYSTKIFFEILGDELELGQSIKSFNIDIQEPASAKGALVKFDANLDYYTVEVKALLEVVKDVLKTFGAERIIGEEEDREEELEKWMDSYRAKGIEINYDYETQAKLTKFKQGSNWSADGLYTVKENDWTYKVVDAKSIEYNSKQLGKVELLVKKMVTDESFEPVISLFADGDTPTELAGVLPSTKISKFLIDAGIDLDANRRELEEFLNSEELAEMKREDPEMAEAEIKSYKEMAAAKVQSFSMEFHENGNVKVIKPFKILKYEGRSIWDAMAFPLVQQPNVQMTSFNFDKHGDLIGGDLYSVEFKLNKLEPAISSIALSSYDNITFENLSGPFNYVLDEGRLRAEVDGKKYSISAKNIRVEDGNLMSFVIEYIYLAGKSVKSFTIDGLKNFTDPKTFAVGQRVEFNSQGEVK